MTAVHRPRCFLEVSHAQEPLGRMTVELFADKTPKTCENFRQLCTGEHRGLTYAQAPFHRVIDQFMIQGGDIANGDGTGTASIYDGEFGDENLKWRNLDAAGLVCSANRGKDTNGSQFFITLEPCEHLNGKHTVFGRLVSGEDVVRKIAAVDVDKNDRPIEPVLISRCGELEKRKKAASQPHTVLKEPAMSSDRGRKRSNNSDDDIKDSPEPAKARQARRQSDNVVDEGLRGRPRQRTRSRSPSKAMSTPSEEMSYEQQSPVEKHKRKRSPSPSRPTDRQDGGERRRRSLPNQYHEGEKRYRPGPRRDDHQHRHRQNEHGDSHQGRREDGRGDRYRPRDRHRDDGRLGGGGGRLGGAYDEAEPPVKFKGRGVMKYREPGRL
ncbi:Pro isomerase-domain-containing protein [Teratosphaeria destructans]|uniref:peptidylprolyl isomerase n=1 Tax=Teratosphaeria destructans TaxID=418781 RepID=A0A9W7SL52_9PEZI|nr:Pro isomerase-domain-containing protein [Teratosphaeria destructans]